VLLLYGDLSRKSTVFRAYLALYLRKSVVF
jgi:hypothetical protein